MYIQHQNNKQLSPPEITAAPHPPVPFPASLVHARGRCSGTPTLTLAVGLVSCQRARTTSSSWSIWPFFAGGLVSVL